MEVIQKIRVNMIPIMKRMHAIKHPHPIVHPVVSKPGVIRSLSFIT